MTLDELLDGIRDREGTRYAEPPAIDQPTGPYGVTVPMLAASRGRVCFPGDLRRLTVDEARQIVRTRLEADLAGLGFNRISDEHLRVQLLDYAWNSGEARAVRWLQRTVGLPPALVTGELDERTLAALARWPAWLVNNALAGERAHAAYAGGVDPKFAAGVARRAIAFVIPLDQQMTT